MSDDAPFLDPLSAPSKPPEDEGEELDDKAAAASPPASPKLSSTPPPETELKDTALPPRPDAPPPTATQAETPTTTSTPPAFDGTSGGPSTPAAPAPSPGIKPGRVISEAEREQLKLLGEHREALKAGYNSRRTVAEADKIIEEKVHSALQGRSSVGMHGVKDLLAFVKGHADMEEAAAKNFTRFSTLFGQETGTTNDALLGYSSSCKSMQKLHSDLSNTLTSVELKRAEESHAAFEDGAKKVTSAASTMVNDLQHAREKVEKAYQAQEKAWADCEEADKHSARVASVESDPWLAGLRYQSAVKALETVQNTHGSDLSRLVQEMKAHDLKRLETMKSILRSYAESRRNLLQKALQNAEELCSMIDKIEPTQDSEGFLAAADISEFDLQKSEEASADNSGAPGPSQSALGVWIPDEAVRHCNRCNLAFGMMRRKHHCRRCGHVFCDKCSGRTAVLPQSFGFNTQPQRVCEPCLELLQSMTPESGGGGEHTHASVSLEVLKEGPLHKKGGLLKSGSGKQRHFVCTRAGFLHYFESKFDPQPKGSICLHYARITNADDDACALVIDIEESSGGFFALRQKMAKTKYVLRTGAGSVERDGWVKILQSCSNYGMVSS